MKVSLYIKHSRYMQYISAITASLSLTSVATYITWASPSLPKLTSENSPIGTTITSAEASWVASSFLLGAIPGSLVAGFIVEKFGRRGSLLLSVIPLFVPWIVILFAKSALVLIIARLVAGIGNAIALTAAPMYNGEIAEKDIRGKLGVSCNLLMNAGNFFVLSVGPFVSYTALTISCSAFPLIFVILFYFMPESPYYLIKTGKKDSARNNLIRLSSNSVDDKIINDRLDDIENTVQVDMKNKSTLWEFLSKKEYRSSLFIMMAIRTLQQWSGMAAIETYMQTIIESSNSSISPEKSSIIFGFIEVLAVFISAALVDKMGRKPLLITSALGCALSLIGGGTYFYLQDVARADISNISWLPTTSLALYLLLNHVGVFSLPYVLLGEFFATNIKGVAVSAFTTYNAVLAFLVMKLYEPISNAWGIHTTLWIYAGICILGSVFVLFFLPETKGKSFAEIQGKLNRNRSVQASLSLTSVATYITWTSPSLLKLTSDNSPIGITITSEEASWVASSYLLGAIPGSLVAGLLVEKFGRRGTLLLSAIPLFVPWIVLIFAKSVLVLIVARFVAGIGNALAVTAAPMYNGEIAEKDIRGKLGVCCSLLMNAGNFFVLSVGPFVSYTALTLSCGAFSLIFVILFYFMPESPYYLIKTGKDDSARNNLIRLSSKNVDEDIIKCRFEDIETTVQGDMKNNSTLWEFFSKKEYRNSLFIMMAIRTLQQWSGMAAIEMYVQTIIESSSSSISPGTSSMIFGFIELLAVLISVTLVDKMGRKPLLVTSALGCALSLIGGGTYFYLQDVVGADMNTVSWLPTTSLALYLLLNHAGVFTLPYVLLGEFFATNIKGVAVSVFTTYNSILCFLVIKLYEPISNAWGIHTTLWIYAGICILGSVFVLFFLPETKGKSFAEIQEKLNKTRSTQCITLKKMVHYNV